MRSFTHIATKSIPIVSNLLKRFARSNLVPTPSVEDTIRGSFILTLLISNKDPKAPILFEFLVLFFFLTFFF